MKMLSRSSPSPVLPTLLAPDFARLDDHHAPLCTPTLRALGVECISRHSLLGSPKIASPTLMGWTPRLTASDDQPVTTLPSSLASLERTAFAAPFLAIAPAPATALPIPTLLHSNFLLPSRVPTNIIVATGPEHQEHAKISSLRVVRTKAEPTASTGSDSDGGHQVLDKAVPQPGSGAKRKRAIDVVPQVAVEVVGVAHGREAAPTAAPSAIKGGRPGSDGGSLPPDEDMTDTRLTLEFLEENGYFDMPIQQAAAELRVGVTTLKKVCRVNSIGRWPFRKRSSLNRLIDKTREYFANEPEQCAEALAQLESQRAVLKTQQGEDIPESVKRYRQSIFKLDYKVKCAKRGGKRRQPAADSSGICGDLLTTLGLALQPPTAH